MKRDALLINVARAAIVDEDALYAALKAGHLGGAALDVWWQYPSRGQYVRGLQHGPKRPRSRLRMPVGGALPWRGGRIIGVRDGLLTVTCISCRLVRTESTQWTVFQPRQRNFGSS